MPGNIAFAIPGDIETRTGGTVYDKRVMEELRLSGWTVAHLAWPAAFPFPSDSDVATAAASLAACPDGTLVLIDGLALGVLPELAAAHGERLRLVAMLHHPLALETGLSPAMAASFAKSEKAALKHVCAIIVTSEMTAATLRADYDVGLTPIRVARPGIDRPANIAPAGNLVPRILSVGTVTPRKAHDLLVESLAMITDLKWHCTIAGSLDRAPETVAKVRSLIDTYSMGSEISLIGEVSDLEPLYRTSDVFVSSSKYEGYGMAIAEALGHGLPVIAVRAGAVPEVVPDAAGILVPVDDPYAMAKALRALVGDAAYRADMAAAAAIAAQDLPRWTDTAKAVALALDAVQL